MADLNLGDGIDLLQQRAKIVKTLLIVGLAATVAILIGEFGELNGDISLANPDASPMDQLYLVALYANAAIALITVIIFAMWIYRAAANVVAARVPGFSYTPGWAVGWYFIPIANLFKPFSAMRQIWNASHGERDRQLNHTSGLLALWWGCWILSSIGTLIPFRLNFDLPSTEILQIWKQIGLIASASSLAGYLAAYQMVDRVTAAQRDRLNAAHIFA